MRKLLLVFPGQGSQYVGMGKSLFDRYPSARAAIEEGSDVLGFDLRKLMHEGDPEELTRTENAQPALLAASVAAFRVYMEEIGVAPLYAAGHSLGEFSALTCAGALNYADALRLVRRRGQLMKEAAAEGTGTMCAIIGLSVTTVKAACLKESAGTNESVAISNLNSPDQIVISGHGAAVERVANQLEQEGGRIAYLNVSAPFHSALMKPASIQFEEELRAYRFGSFKWPVISNVTAKPYESPVEIASHLSAQLTAPVRWAESMQLLSRMGISAAVELGAKNVLTRLMKPNVPTITCYTLENDGDIGTVREQLSAEIAQQHRTNARHNVVTLCVAAAVCTRNRNDSLAEYEQGFIEPYRRLQQLQEQLDEAGEGSMPSPQQSEEALTLLKGMLETKKVPEAERRERFRTILMKSGTEQLYSQYASV
ncbi:[acyl-carrier-protein] S-malonyltransferase [Paenibacillus sp. 1011MAR3C5]|uniref:ACP S-malonyltransferase n=1 Tax=Paenibacillus sp. 1011MAR3C5 TaxID=1675787 RepID=UPI000E6D4860|nr:ACP S-malonyltransferase [Paenibacillus sp. 1011MAR3C5]RJE89654.1 [acyl-carrier-protein] S-malonyltransferase [Paenibacillus sp. 1011MAR3C5]